MFLFPSLGSIWCRFTNQFRMTTATIKCFISTTSSRIAAKLNASLYMLDKNTRLKQHLLGTAFYWRQWVWKNGFAPALTLNIQGNFKVTSSMLVHRYPRTGYSASEGLLSPTYSRWVKELKTWLFPIIRLIQQIQTSTARVYSFKIGGLSNTQ